MATDQFPDGPLSAILYAAARDIVQYQRKFPAPYVRPDIREEINQMVVAMEALRLKLKRIEVRGAY